MKTQNKTNKIRKTPRVVLIVDTSREYGRNLLRGIADYCKLHGSWDVHIERTMETSKIHELLTSWNADALITDIPYDNNVHTLSKINLPLITTMASETPRDDIYYVDCDGIRTGKMAAEHLESKQFKNYAFCGYEDMVWSRMRGRGFAQTLREKGYNVSIYEQPRDRAIQDWNNELHDITQWLKTIPQPAAILACNDDRARHVVEACRNANLKIPDQIAVMGVDNDEIPCNLFNPPLTSIAFNTERTGYEAAELLDKIISGEQPESKAILVQPKYVVERQSTDVLQVDDEHVARALRFIRQNSNRILQVSDVLDCVSISRRTLQLKFRQTLGYTISREIRNAHARQIAKLLVETNLPVLEIARSLGYTSDHNISRFFKQSTGYTPKAYRKKFGHK